MQELDDLILVWMHVNLVNQSVETKVEGGVSHRRRQVLRSEVRRVYIQ